MICYLDSAHQNSWKTLYSNKSYDHIHKKQIYNQLFSSDKMMVQVTKTLTILCFMVLHLTKMIFCFSKIFLVRDHWSLVAVEIIFHHCHQYWFGDMTFINIIRNDVSTFLLVPKHYFEFPNILDTK